MSKKKKKKSLSKGRTKKSKTQKQSFRYTREFRGLMLLAFSFLTFLSLISFAYGKTAQNWLGLFGYMLGFTLHSYFGVGSYLLTLFGSFYGLHLLFSQPINHWKKKVFYFSILLISFNFLITVFETSFLSFRLFFEKLFYPFPYSRGSFFHLGGSIFYYLYKDLPNYNLHLMLYSVGTTIIFSSTFIAASLLLTETPFAKVLEVLSSVIQSIRLPKISIPKFSFPTIFGPRIYTENQPKKSLIRSIKLRMPSIASEKNHETTENDDDFLQIQPKMELTERPSLSKKEGFDIKTAYRAPFSGESQISEQPLSTKPLSKREKALQEQSVYNGDFTHYKIPPLKLISDPVYTDQTNLKKDLKRQAEVLEETLQSFGIEARVGQVNCGPRITSFEVHPAIGVKVQKIKTLENDIALNMEAKSIRILAPIPGKAAVGIEVPNPHPQEVGFKDMLKAFYKRGGKIKIPMLLGKSVNGDYVMSDLTKMPHCIIAGATGSGKSVCINTIVMSILMTAKPDEIKLLLVDPKKVELTPYDGLPHLLSPVITEPDEAKAALNWLVKEMERRYEILTTLGLRNIDAFNKRQINEEYENSLKLDIPKKMPFMVGIIDEFADLMMISSSDIETPIARIAQMARAVGIHLILATQRPSREVITGLIKANFPTRISFKVASRINSQIILDETGAESLLGNGDMLFLAPGASHVIRAQGAFIRDEDINNVCNFAREQSPCRPMIQSFKDLELSRLSNSSEDIERDSLYDQALNIVTSTGNASTTFLQRKLKIGYARAASIMDQLEEAGVVSPPDGSKPRKVLIKNDE